VLAAFGTLRRHCLFMATLAAMFLHQPIYDGDTFFVVVAVNGHSRRVPEFGCQ
jgi:hypothetical protein